MHSLTSFLSKKFKVDAHYFLSGGFWLLVAQASTVISSLVVAVVFANSLSETEYGVYRYILGLAVLLSTFSLTGIGQAVLQASAAGHKKFFLQSSKITLFWSAGIIVAALSGFLYYLLNDNTVLAVSCLLIALFQPVSQIFSNTLSHLYGEERYMTGSMLQAVKSVFVSGASLLTIFFTQNILLLAAVFLFTQALSALVSFLFFKPNLSSTEISIDVPGNYYQYAKNSSLRNVFTGLAMRLDAIVIFQFLGAAELAIYSIATLLPEHIKGSFKNIQTLLLPKYSKTDSLKEFKANIPLRSIQLFFILLAITCIFILSIPYVYEILFPKYLESVRYVQVLALAFPASIFLIPLGVLQGQQMEKELYIYQLSSSFVQIILLITLLACFGVVGAIFSKVITEYYKTFISFLLLYKTKENSFL
jgi:O-antigen/teichoic acid export membrane protein